MSRSHKKKQQPPQHSRAASTTFSVDAIEQAIRDIKYPLQLHGASLTEFLHACSSIAFGFSLHPTEFARAFSDFHASHAAHKRLLNTQDLNALSSWIVQRQQQQGQADQRARTLREIRMQSRPASASPVPRCSSAAPVAPAAAAARRKPVVKSSSAAVPAVLTVPLDLTSAAMSAQMRVQAAKQHQLKEMTRIVSVSLASSQPWPHTAAVFSANGSSHSARTSHRAASHSSPSQHPDPEARANYLRWVAAASTSAVHNSPAAVDGEEGVDAAAERRRERRQRKAMKLLHQQLSNGAHHNHAPPAASAEASASSHSVAASSSVIAPVTLSEDLFPSFTSPERHLLSAWFRDAQLKHAALATQLAELRDTQQQVLRALESTGGSAASGAEAEEFARLAQETQRSITKLAEQVAMLKQPETAVRQLSEQHAAAQAARQALNGSSNGSFTSPPPTHAVPLDYSTASAPLLASTAPSAAAVAAAPAVVNGRARTRASAAPAAAINPSLSAPAAALLIPGVLPKQSITQERKQRQQQLMAPSASAATTQRSMHTTTWSVTQPHSQPHSRRASITSVASSPQLLNRHAAVASAQHWRSSSAERSSASPPTSHRSASSSAALERFYSPSRFKVDAAGVQSGAELAGSHHRSRASARSASLSREEQAQWANSLVESMVVDLPLKTRVSTAGRYRSPFPPREPSKALASFPSARDRHRSPSLDPPPYTRYTHTLHKHLSNVRAEKAMSPPRSKPIKTVRDTFGPART